MENLSTLQLPLNGPIDQTIAVLPVGDGLELYTTADQVAVFCRGLCIFTFAANDRFSRNYCIVQLYQSGNFKLKYLSEMFHLNYQHCSKILGLFKKFGLEGLKEDAELNSYNRKVIDSEIGAVILAARDRGTSYEDIANEIRFKFKKKILAKSVRNWVSRENCTKNQSPRTAKNEICLPNQLLMEVGQAGSDFTQDGGWHRNIYAGRRDTVFCFRSIKFVKIVRRKSEGRFFETSEQLRTATGNPHCFLSSCAAIKKHRTEQVSC